MPQQIVVCQRGGGDLEAGDIKLRDEIDRPFVPTGSEPIDLHFFAVTVNLLVFLDLELEAALQVAIGRAERIFAGLRQFLGGVNDIDRPLVEFDRAATSAHRDVDQLFGKIDVAIMVNADFSDDIARLCHSDCLRTQSDLCFVGCGSVVILVLHRYTLLGKHGSTNSANLSLPVTILSIVRSAWCRTVRQARVTNMVMSLFLADIVHSYTVTRESVHVPRIG